MVIGDVCCVVLCVAYSTLKTVVLGMSPLTISCKAFGKKGGYLLGNVTSFCLHGIAYLQAGRGAAIGQ